MGNVEALADQVGGILGRHEISFSAREGGGEYVVQHGSTAVFIGFSEAAGTTFVTLSSPLLHDIDLSGDKHGRALVLVNSLNCNEIFARFCLREAQDEQGAELGMIAIEHDLLGPDLQGSELVTCLKHLAVMADDLDEKLEGEVGGTRFEAALDESQEAVDT